MYVLWPESLLSIIKLGSETTVEYKHSSASTGINYGCSPSRCPPIIEKRLCFLQLLTPFPTNIFCHLPIVLTSLQQCQPDLPGSHCCYPNLQASLRYSYTIMKLLSFENSVILAYAS